MNSGILRDPLLKGLLRSAWRSTLLAHTLVTTPFSGDTGAARVFYGGARSGNIGGPLVKVKRLREYFPEHRWDYNLVYTLSNAPYLTTCALNLLRLRKIPIVLNQNGVFYPGWYKNDWKGMNAVMARAYHRADHVFWQSHFCRRAADRFLGPRQGSGEILYNAIDTQKFIAATTRPERPFTFLVTGKIGKHMAYRLESTVAGLAYARNAGLRAILKVSGSIEYEALVSLRHTARSASIEDYVSFTGPYTQEEAPAIYAAADAYVTTTYMDNCPNAVIEALSCGLPVLYSASGGVPELVGVEAGIGLEVPEDWEATHTPAAEAIGDGMLRIANNASAMGQVARQRAVAQFDIQNWIARHQQVFQTLLETKSIPASPSLPRPNARPVQNTKVTSTESHNDPLIKTLLRRGWRTTLLAHTITAAPLSGRGSEPKVFYGGARSGNVGGPLVKVKRLREYFPEHLWTYNLVYTLSNAPYLPASALDFLRLRNIPIVLNQNGVFYSGWYKNDWQGMNAVMARAYHRANHVFWQSHFCRRAADRFLGPRQGDGEVLFNAIDTRRFCPPEHHTERPFTFLITGKIDAHLSYRLESTIAGLAAAHNAGLDARLVIAGWVAESARVEALAAANRLGVGKAISFTGAYTQEDAPVIYGAADAYVMTKYLDPCPNTVLEAMACGLPVLYSNSGGVPELVGPDAGIGLPVPEDWETIHIPSAEAIGAGMLAMAKTTKIMGIAARQRAVAEFDIIHWIDRHRQVFRSLLETCP
ncbi:MAG: glycosyltransferase family 4 protein [Rhodospirillaceae bacterium]|nr:glycosyltransferase family 4 protein [Rhodospirillaceae bacterium]